MQTLSMGELAARTGVPPASIHHYLKLGLLPEAGRVSANRFLYDERHVLGLRLIRTLRQRRRLALAEVRRILPELLYLEEEEAFRPEIWDRALAPSRRQHPSQRILSAAKDAFGRRSYGEVNVEDICALARVAKGSFYRHYRSKDLLFLAAATSVAGDVASAFEQDVSRTGPVSADRAAAILSGHLAPHASLFLELLARSLRAGTGDSEVAAEIFQTASSRIGRWVRGGGSLERGSRTIGSAVALGLRPVLSPRRVSGEASVSSAVSRSSVGSN